MMTMQPSVTKMNRNSLQASSPREVTREWQAKRDETRGSWVRGKKVRALRFLRPSRLRHSLARLPATRNGEVALSP